ncbi:unnamed protein product, partial [Urochloa humidicola]
GGKKGRKKKGEEESNCRRREEGIGAVKTRSTAAAVRGTTTASLPLRRVAAPRPDIASPPSRGTTAPSSLGTMSHHRHHLQGRDLCFPFMATPHHGPAVVPRHVDPPRALVL